MSAPRRLPPWVALLLVFAAAVTAQGAVLANGWVWDDAVARDDPAIDRGLAAVPSLLTSSWLGDVNDAGLYRPLVSASLAVEVDLHGKADHEHLDAFGFHLTNLVLHGLAAALLLAVLLRLLPGRPVVSTTAALLFAIHPMHTGTVSWIVARGDLLAAVFGLLAVLVWFRTERVTAARAALAALLTFLAVMGKEMAATLPVAIWLLDAGVRREGLFGPWKRRPLAYLGLLAAVGAYAVLRVASVGHLGTSSATVALAGRGLFQRAAIGLGGLFRTGGMLALPVGLSGDASSDPLYEATTPLPAAYVFGAVLAAGLTILCLVRLARGRARILDAAWGLFVVLSLPVMQIVPLGAIFEDRFAYVPSLALLLVGGLAAERVLARPPRLVAAVLLAVVALALGSAAWATAADWKDDFAFNEALVRDQPKHRDALRRLGRAHYERGKRRIELAAARPTGDPTVPATRDAGIADLRASAEILERATALPGTRQGARTWKALGDAQSALGDYASAAASYLKALALKRVRLDGTSVPVSEVPRGDASSLVDRVPLADRSFVADVRFHRGIALIAIDDRDAGIAELRAAAAWTPGDVEIQQRTGTALLGAGRPRESLPYLAAALALSGPEKRTEADTSFKDARDAAVDLARKKVEEAKKALAGVGAAGALAAYEAAVDAWPDEISAWNGALDVLESWKGDRDEAVARLESLKERLDPKDVPAKRVDRAAVGARIERLIARYAK